MLTGELSAVPDDEWSELQALTTNRWRPNTLQTATIAGGVGVYEFAISEQAGIRQTGLAPGFRENIEP